MYLADAYQLKEQVLSNFLLLIQMHIEQYFDLWSEAIVTNRKSEIESTSII